jgi:hypothetical protein
LKPIAELAGKRIFLWLEGKVVSRKASTFFASSVPSANSMPA